MLLWKHLGRKSGDPPIKNALVYAKVNQLILQDILSASMHSLIWHPMNIFFLLTQSVRAKWDATFPILAGIPLFLHCEKFRFFLGKRNCLMIFPRKKKTENKTRKNVLNFIPEWYRQHVSAQVPAPAQFASVASHRKQNDEWLDWSKWRMLHDQGF